MGKKNNTNKKKTSSTANNAQAKSPSTSGHNSSPIPQGSHTNQNASPNKHKTSLPPESTVTPTPSIANGKTQLDSPPASPAAKLGQSVSGSSAAVNGRAEPANDPEELKEQGNFYFKDKEYEVAIDLYSQALALKQDATYYSNRAAAYMGSAKWKPAKDDCITSISLSGNEPPTKTLARLSKCHLMLGEPAAALSTADQTLKLEPTNASALSTKQSAERMQHFMDRCTSAQASKDWGQAKWALAQAFDKYDTVPVEWKVLKIELDVAKRQWDDALKSAADCLRLDANDPDILTVRGLVMFLTNQISTSLEHLRTALRMDQEHNRARPLLKRVRDVEKTKEEGNTHFRKAEWDNAVDKYTQTLDLVGEEEREGGGGQIRSVLLSNRATTYLKIKKHEEALADTQAAIELMPKSYKALRTQARVYLAMEDYEEAVRGFKQAKDALEHNPVELSSINQELRNAEVLLKRSKTKDYYKILGVHREATTVEIKRAYRRESLLHHPDKGGDEEKFKLVSEAHNILSDSDKRAKYDNGEDPDGLSDGMGFGGMDINDLIFQMGSGGAFGGGGRRGGGGFPGAHFHSGGPFGFR